MSSFTITWDDANSRPNVIEGLSGIAGGDNPGFLSNATGYDEGAPPMESSSDDEEFSSSVLDDRWKFFGTVTEGNVARGISFTTPSNSARYSLTNRPGWFQLQPVSEAMSTGQGIYAELSESSKLAGNAPTNWLLNVGTFLEVDMSSLPISNQDSTVLVGLWDKALDGTADLTKFVGCFIGTDFTTPDSPIVVGAVKIVPPNDMDSFGPAVRLPALPPNSRVKIHKIGTTFRVYLLVDGRNLELGSVSLPTLNPVMFGLIHANTDTPNAISMTDYFRHKFVDTDAE